MKLTNSMALSPGYTVLFTFSPPVAGYYLLQGQMAYQWVVGTVQWNSSVYCISVSINSYDSECYYSIFERNPRVSGTAGTDTLITNRVLYIAPMTPVYFHRNFIRGVNNFVTV